MFYKKFHLRNWILVDVSQFSRVKNFHRSQKVKDERRKLKNKNSINIKYSLQLNLYLFYAFSSQWKALLSDSVRRFMLSLDQWKKSSGKQNDDKAMRWEKTNFMAFSWLYFLRKIVLFMTLRYTKLFALHAFFLLPSRSSLLKNNVFCVSELFLNLYWISFYFFFVSRIYFSRTVFRYKRWIHESWYRDIPHGYL